MHEIPHNHITRDVKPIGECYGCDRYHALSGVKRINDMENFILLLDQMFESRSSDAVKRYIEVYIDETNMRARHPDA